MNKTAESVSPKHPDKLCDRVSDAILDECLKQDPNSRVAIETMGGHGSIDITGEITTKGYVDMRAIALGIVGKGYGIKVNVVQQSPEIANGVDKGGAGDQGIMTGYACNENEAMIPQEQWLARHLCQTIYSHHPNDGKTQITIDEKGIVMAVVASFQGVSKSHLTEVVEQWLNEYVGREKVYKGVKLHINAAGDWDIGGFEADTGVTGRKLMVDNYGPQVAVGGGCFSGKDPSKVDRSGAYMARYIAVQLIKKTNRKEATVKLAYAIGVAEPVMATATVDGEVIDLIDWGFDLTPAGIIKTLDLKRPQYEMTAQWGHFGNGFTWDK
jgi:S-adenosylmethionine synthetase